MKRNFSLLQIVPFALALSAMSIARAAAPVINLTVDSFLLGDGVTFTATVTDADADMDYAKFEVNGPGTSGWLHLTPNVNVPSPGTSAQQTGVSVPKSWTPTLPGLWSVRVTVYDLTGSASLSRTFDVLDGTITMSPRVVPSGANLMFLSSGELITPENTSSTALSVESGGSLILWAGGRVKLKPGFHAVSGSFFWAAVDHNMNGYSDIEEATDTDGDGMNDAWEVDHGLSAITNDAAGDLDGDGMTNLQEFLSGRDPNNRADGPTLPSGYGLVLRLPTNQFFGVNTSTWSMTGIAAP